MPEYISIYMFNVTQVQYVDKNRVQRLVLNKRTECTFHLRASLILSLNYL